MPKACDFTRESSPRAASVAVITMTEDSVRSEERMSTTVRSAAKARRASGEAAIVSFFMSFSKEKSEKRKPDTL